MIHGVLLDLSGVLYVGDKVLPGALDAVQSLMDSGLPVRYITNTTRKTSAKILDQLKNMRFQVSPDELFTAPMAARDYLKQHNLVPYLLIHPDLEPEFPDFRQRNDINAVLVGDAGDGFTYSKMNEAFRHLQTGASFLALGVNRYFKDGGQFSLDAGAFVRALEYATDSSATVIGKPPPEFYLSAVNSIGCRPEQVMMVGDDVDSDVLGAIESGLQGILVRTGKYRSGDEKILDNKAHCTADINQAVEIILQNASH